jgi:hypothetical protein
MDYNRNSPNFAIFLIIFFSISLGLNLLLNKGFETGAFSQLAQIVSSQNKLSTFVPGSNIKYYGFYWAENDYFNLHYMSELKSSSNIVKLMYDFIQQNPQTLANTVRQNGYGAVDMMLSLHEGLLTNKNGARDAYLAGVKKKLFQDSDLGKLVVHFHIWEEPYSWLFNGYYDTWDVFKNIDLVACKNKYPGKVNTIQDCKNSILKEGLEQYIDSIHQYFPGIPVVIVEAKWDNIYVPPTNLDILGIDAYYLPTSQLCDATQMAKFNVEVTNAINNIKQFGKPIQLVGGVFKSGQYTFISPCQAQWYIDLAKNTPEITSFNWFLYADVDGVLGVRGHGGELLEYVKKEGRRLLNKPPVVSSLSTNPNMINANASDKYTIAISTTDPNGAEDVKVQYVLVNQFSSADKFRGYFGWSKDGDLSSKYYFPQVKSSIPCTGGGIANKAVGFGEEYVNLISCSTTVSGKTRITSFVVTFNPNFLTPRDNTIYGWSADEFIGASPWTTYSSAKFSVLKASPVVESIIMSPKPVSTDGKTIQNITITTSDQNGAEDVKVQYILVNHFTDKFRGYVGWSKDGNLSTKYYFPQIVNSVPCIGGGTANEAAGFGGEYMNIVFCSTAVSGNSRVTTFGVTFDTNYTGNTIYGWTADESLGSSPWTLLEKFDLK